MRNLTSSFNHHSDCFSTSRQNQNPPHENTRRLQVITLLSVAKPENSSPLPPPIARSPPPNPPIPSSYLLSNTPSSSPPSYSAYTHSPHKPQHPQPQHQSPPSFPIPSQVDPSCSISRTSPSDKADHENEHRNRSSVSCRRRS